MEQGIEREPHARKKYESFCNCIVDEVGGIQDGELWYSPDGMVGEDGLIEIKCPQPVKHLRNLLDVEMWKDYEHQIQFGLMVSGRKWCDFISFNPDFPSDNAFKVVRVERDEAYIALLRERVKALDVMVKGIESEVKHD